MGACLLRGKLSEFFGSPASPRGLLPTMSPSTLELGSMIGNACAIALRYQCP